MQSLVIDDLEFLMQYPSLEILDISYCTINDITELKNMTSLKSLHMLYTPIDDLSPLYHLPNFCEIYLDNDFDRSKVDFMIDHFRDGDDLTKEYIIRKRYSLD